MTDRLQEIEARWDIVVPESAKDKKLRRHSEFDISWLIAEVKRLRRELALYLADDEQE